MGQEDQVDQKARLFSCFRAQLSRETSLPDSKARHVIASKNLDMKVYFPVKPGEPCELLRARAI